ncbi:MAG: CGNR zinc finger domain-containing protein [Gemmatimonadetes bacterium]|nr:CGNR zinc finger domain-containing protein [Gemmatimonadota bacterium]MDA1103537.1 CGNR zinc finger domain-containing protein [Gemmatimonadota bacterium]
MPSGSGDESLALHFVNTRMVDGPRPIDAIGTPEGLQSWFERHGLDRSPSGFPKSLPDRHVLVMEAMRLRDAINRMFTAVSSGAAVDSMTLATINRCLSADSLSTRLTLTDSVLTVEHFGTATSPLALLASLALSAAEVLEHSSRSRLRQCAGATCRHWFVDTSKGGQRRWCSMSRCGNRSKAARFRETNAPDS